jgi:26S proteasome regulatory subunit N1
MSLRTMNHLLQYGEPIIRRTVPLAIGLLRISNPEVQSMDLLNKLAYDSDK